MNRSSSIVVRVMNVRRGRHLQLHGQERSHYGSASRPTTRQQVMNLAHFSVLLISPTEEDFHISPLWKTKKFARCHNRILREPSPSHFVSVTTNILRRRLTNLRTIKTRRDSVPFCWKTRKW